MRTAEAKMIIGLAERLKPLVDEIDNLQKCVDLIEREQAQNGHIIILNVRGWDVDGGAHNVKIDRNNMDKLKDALKAVMADYDQQVAEMFEMQEPTIGHAEDTDQTEAQAEPEVAGPNEPNEPNSEEFERYAIRKKVKG